MAGKSIIAVVDDDPSVRRALGRLLCAAGFETTLFASGAQCLAAPVTAEAACFLIDIHLVGLDGFEICEALRRGDVRAPVILMTAHDSAETRSRALAVTNGAYLRKPFDAERLLDLIRALVPRDEPPAGLSQRSPEFGA